MATKITVHRPVNFGYTRNVTVNGSCGQYKAVKDAASGTWSLGHLGTLVACGLKASEIEHAVATHVKASQPNFMVDPVGFARSLPR